jgi:hypothetical protein
MSEKQTYPRVGLIIEFPAYNYKPTNKKRADISKKKKSLKFCFLSVTELK